MRQGHISGTQLTILLSFLLGAKILYLFPTLLSARVGSSAWLAATISTLFALIGLWGWVLWVKATGNSGFVVSLRQTLGRILGDAVALGLLVLYISVGSWNIRVFIGGAVIGIVPEFPIDAVIYIMVLSSIYGAWLGLEAVGRAAVFFFAPGIVSLAVVVASLFRTFHIENLLPLWGLGAKTTVQTGLLGTGIYGAMSAVGILKSYVRKQDEIPRSSFYGTLLAAAIIILGLVALAGIFPYPMNTRKVEPFGVMARSVFLGRFVQRLEALFTFTWFFTTAVQASLNYVLILIMLAQLGNCGTYRPFVPAVAVLTFGMAGIPANTVRAAQLVDIYFTRNSGIALVALGWALYLVARARGIATGRKQAEPQTGHEGSADRTSASRENP